MMVGRSIESYQVTRPLGSERFEVYHPKHGKAVLRLLLPKKSLGGPAAVAAAHEVMATAALRLCALSHRNLVRVLHGGLLQPEKIAFVIEEMPFGEALGERLAEQGPVVPKEGLLLLAQAAAGLSALHQGGLTHGNLSLHTVRVDHAGGMASMHDTGSPLVQLAEVLPGAGPDQGADCMGEDLRHLGAIFCELIGVPPPGPPEQRSPRGSQPPLTEMLHRALQRNPQSARELFERVEAAVRKSGILTGEDSAFLMAGRLRDDHRIVHRIDHRIDHRSVHRVGDRVAHSIADPSRTTQPLVSSSGASAVLTQPIETYIPPQTTQPLPSFVVSIPDLTNARSPPQTPLTAFLPPSGPEAGGLDDAPGDEEPETWIMSPPPVVPPYPGVPEPPTQAVRLVDTVDEEAATVEVERMDPQELLALFPGTSQSLIDLVGPLDKKAAPTKRWWSRPHFTRKAIAGQERGPGRGTAPSGSAGRWLLPLGLCAALTLGLAAWVLWGPGTLAHQATPKLGTSRLPQQVPGGPTPTPRDATAPNRPVR